MSAPDLPPSPSPVSPPLVEDADGKGTATVGEHAKIVATLRARHESHLPERDRVFHRAADLIESLAAEVARLEAERDREAEAKHVAQDACTDGNRLALKLQSDLAERDVDLAHARTVIEKLRAVPGDYLDDLPYQAPGGYLMRDSAESISERMAAIS